MTRPVPRAVTRRLPARAVAVALAAALALSACTHDAATPEGGASSTGASTTPSAADPDASSPATPSPATRPWRPETGACYRLGYDEALAPTTDVEPVPCRGRHTAVTYYVGTLRTVVAGHLLAVDASRVHAQVTRECPRRLPAFLEADPARLRLSVLRPVWFSPSLAQADEGQDWFRCDVIALAGEGRLAPLDTGLADALATPAGRAAYGVCGTAEPGTPGFARVICRNQHTWRAISTYDLRGKGYPGRAKVQETARTRCQADAEETADDPLNYRWGYDWPTAEQWRAGQRYGLCWAPDGQPGGG